MRQASRQSMRQPDASASLRAIATFATHYGRAAHSGAAVDASRSACLDSPHGLVRIEAPVSGTEVNCHRSRVAVIHVEPSGSSSRSSPLKVEVSRRIADRSGPAIEQKTHSRPSSGGNSRNLRDPRKIQLCWYRITRILRLLPSASHTSPNRSIAIPDTERPALRAGPPSPLYPSSPEPAIIESVPSALIRRI